MIKKYDQFIKNKTNEEFVAADPATKPEVRPGRPETRPSTNPRPTPPSPIPGKRVSPIPTPAKAKKALLRPEEEEDEYIGSKMIVNLADALGVDIEDDNSIIYNGNKINFYSEDEKFHIGNKTFKNEDEVIKFLGVDNSEIEEEGDENFGYAKHDGSFDEDDSEGDEDFGYAKHDGSFDEDDSEIKEEEDALESKSYRRSRFRKIR